VLRTFVKDETAAYWVEFGLKAGAGGGVSITNRLVKPVRGTPPQITPRPTQAERIRANIAQNRIAISSSKFEVHVGRERIFINRSSGIQKAADLAADLKGSGHNVVGTELTVRTPFGDRRIDVVIEKGGKLYGIEVKSGGATRDVPQFTKDAWTNRNPTDVVGDKVRDLERVLGRQGPFQIESVVTIHVP
jgi:hypothetical protein